MRVVHLSTVHTSADVRIFLKECRSLAAAGYDVHYCVHSPHAEQADGVTLHALPEPAVPKSVRHNAARARRLWARIIGTYRLAASLKADVYHFHDPELIVVGLLLKRKGARVIYDAHEDSPLEAKTMARHRRIEGLLFSSVWGVLERRAMKKLDGFIGATPTIAAKFPPERTALVQNFPLLGELHQPDAAPYATREPLAAFVGGIGETRSITEMVQAMALLPAELQAKLVLAGPFRTPELEAATRRLQGWARVEYAGFLARPEVASLLGRSRMGLVLYYPLRDHLDAQPNKLFEYMSAGIPVVASDFPLWREIVEGVGCGMPADPQDPESIARAIRWLLEHPDEAEAMGRRGYEAVLSRYNWQAEAPRLMELYQRMEKP